MTTRRGFLGALLAAATAPAFVRASSLMPMWIPSAAKIWTPFDDLDFEEGSFTPAVLGAVGFTVAQGSYTRIGQVVQVRAMVKMSGTARDLHLIGGPGMASFVDKNNQIIVSGTLNAKNDAELDAALPRFLARKRA